MTALDHTLHNPAVEAEHANKPQHSRTDGRTNGQTRAQDLVLCCAGVAQNHHDNPHGQINTVPTYRHPPPCQPEIDEMYSKNNLDIDHNYHLERLMIVQLCLCCHVGVVRALQLQINPGHSCSVAPAYLCSRDKLSDIVEIGDVDIVNQNLGERERYEMISNDDVLSCFSF